MADVTSDISHSVFVVVLVMVGWTFLCAVISEVFIAPSSAANYLLGGSACTAVTFACVLAWIIPPRKTTKPTDG